MHEVLTGTFCDKCGQAWTDHEIYEREDGWTEMACPLKNRPDVEQCKTVEEAVNIFIEEINMQMGFKKFLEKYPEVDCVCIEEDILRDIRNVFRLWIHGNPIVKDCASNYVWPSSSEKGTQYNDLCSDTPEEVSLMLLFLAWHKVKEIYDGKKKH